MKAFGLLTFRAMLFSIGPLSAAVASFVALPVLSEKFGAMGWTAIALGLSLGGAAAVLVEQGWGLDGPARIARAGTAARKTIFALSVRAKLLAFPASAAIAVPLSIMLAPQYQVAAAISAISGAALGLSCAWYMVGAGTPGRLIIVDSLPRVLMALIAAAWIHSGGPIVAYPLMLLAGSILPFVIAIPVIMGRRSALVWQLSTYRVRVAILSQLTALRGRVASSIYLALPAAILGTVSPASVAPFSAAERIQRMALTLLQILPNATLAWAAAPKDSETRWQRVIRGVATNSLIGLLAAVAWYFLMDSIGRLVFSGVISFSPHVVWMSSALVWVTVSSRAVGSIGLVAFGGVRHVSDSATFGAVVGLVLVVILGKEFGVSGAFLALLITELCVLLWQCLAMRAMRRRLSSV